MFAHLREQVLTEVPEHGQKAGNDFVPSSHQHLKMANGALSEASGQASELE